MLAEIQVLVGGDILPAPAVPARTRIAASGYYEYWGFTSAYVFSQRKSHSHRNIVRLPFVLLEKGIPNIRINH